MQSSRRDGYPAAHCEINNFGLTNMLRARLDLGDQIDIPAESLGVVFLRADPDADLFVVPFGLWRSDHLLDCRKRFFFGLRHSRQLVKQRIFRHGCTPLAGASSKRNVPVAAASPAWAREPRGLARAVGPCSLVDRATPRARPRSPRPEPRVNPR